MRARLPSWSSRFFVRLMTLALLAVLVPLLLGLLVSTGVMTRTFEERSEDALQTVNANVADKIQRFLFERESDVRAFSESGVLRSPRAPLATKREHLESLQRIYVTYPWIGLLDAKGVVVASTQGRGEGQDLHAEEWFQAARHGTVIGPLRRDPLAGDKAVQLYAAPVHDEAGRFVGVLTTRMSMRPLIAMLKLGRIGETGESYLVGPDGRLLTESRFVSGAPMRLVLDTPAFTEGRRTAGRSIYRDYRNVPVMGAYMPLTRNGERLTGYNWVVVTEIDRAEADLPLDRLRWLVGAMTLVIALLAAAMVGIAAKRIAAPIEALSEGVARVAAGDYTARVPEIGRDELGALSRGFNAMALEVSRAVALLHEANEAMEAEVTKRTLERLEALEQSEALKDQFLGLVSHELRTPITVVLSSAAIMRRLAPNSAQLGHLEKIERNARSLLSILNDLLDASQLRAGKFHLHLRAIDPSGVLAQTVQDLAVLAGAKRQRLVWEPRPLPVLEVDEGRLAQILRNLIHNAIKFAPEGSTIALETEIRAAMLRFTVTDEGPGVAPEARRAIFDRFHRGAPTGAEKGVGLGLYISRLLTEAHGGRLTVEAGPDGRGARFVFELPLLAHALVEGGGARAARAAEDDKRHGRS